MKIYEDKYLLSLLYKFASLLCLSFVILIHDWSDFDFTRFDYLTFVLQFQATIQYNVIFNRPILRAIFLAEEKLISGHILPYG